MTEVLVDTNVLIYALDVDSEYHAWATQLLGRGNLQCCTTSKNLSELIAVLGRGKEALDQDTILRVVMEIQQQMPVLYPTPESLSQFLELLKTVPAQGTQVHDVEIAAIGLAHGVNHVATVNQKDFHRIPGVTVLSPLGEELQT